MSSSDNRLLGIDFGGTKMAVAVADPDGRVLVSDRAPTLAERGADQALDRALDLAAKLLADAGGTLVSAGVATPGVVRDDGIDLAPNVPGWELLRLAEAVRNRFGVEHVRVDNDLNAAALAELRIGALVNADPGLVIGLGTGVAAAITVGGQVVPGFRGAAGEIAYAVTGEQWPADPHDAMLETTFSGRALDELAAEFSMSGGAAALVSAATVPGPARDTVLARLDELARHLVTCCLMLDPQRIVFVGGVANSALVRMHLESRLRTALPMPPEMVLSTFSADAAMLGAVTLAQEGQTA